MDPADDRGALHARTRRRGSLSAGRQRARRKRFCATLPGAFPVHAGDGRSRVLSSQRHPQRGCTAGDFALLFEHDAQGGGDSPFPL